jgi:hypothetical protein
LSSRHAIADFANSLNLYENSRDVLSRLQHIAGNSNGLTTANGQQQRAITPQQASAFNNNGGCNDHVANARNRSDHDCNSPQQLLSLTSSNSNNYVRMSPRQLLPAADYEPMQFERAERSSSEETARGDCCYDEEEPSHLAEPSRLAPYSCDTLNGAENDCGPMPRLPDKAKNQQMSSSMYCNLGVVVDGEHQVYSEIGGGREQQGLAGVAQRRRSSIAGSDSSGAYNYDTVDSMDIMSDR